MASGSVPSGVNPLGANVTINNGGTHGAVKRNGTGTINLTTPGPSTTTTINVVTGGAVVFDAFNNKSIQLDGATFTVSAFRPIAYTCGVASMTELETACNENANSKGNGKSHLQQLANIFVPGSRNVQVLTASDDYEDAAGRRTKATASETKSKANTHEVSISLSRGQMFINPLRNTRIISSLA